MFLFEEVSIGLFVQILQFCPTQNVILSSNGPSLLLQRLPKTMLRGARPYTNIFMPLEPVRHPETVEIDRSSALSLAGALELGLPGALELPAQA